MNDFNYQFAIYNPVTDTVEVTTGIGTALLIRCNNFNSTVIFDDPNDIHNYEMARNKTVLH